MSILGTIKYAVGGWLAIPLLLATLVIIAFSVAILSPIFGLYMLGIYACHCFADGFLTNLGVCTDAEVEEWWRRVTRWMGPGL